MDISINGSSFSIDLMTIVLFIIIIVLIFLLYKAQEEPDEFDLRDLIVEKETGRVSLSRFGQFIALMVSTWGFVTLTLDGKLTEWYYASYMMIWAAAEGFRKWGSLEITKKKVDRESDYPPSYSDRVNTYNEESPYRKSEQPYGRNTNSEYEQDADNISSNPDSSLGLGSENRSRSSYQIGKEK